MLPVVFDLDGTLVHSAPDIRLGVNTVMAARGLAPFTLEEIVSFIGNGLPRLAQRVQAARGLDPRGFDALHAEISAAYDAVNGQQTRLFPGVGAVLEGLVSRGHPLGLCTNKPLRPTRDVLRHLGLGATFGAVVGGDSLDVKKPAPDPLAATFEALGGRGIYVGDSEVDAATAEALEVPFLLFTGGYRKRPVEELTHAAAFDHFDALPGLITGMIRRRSRP